MPLIEKDCKCMTQRLSQLVTGTVPACDKKKTIEEYQNNKMTEIVRIYCLMSAMGVKIDFSKTA